MLGTGMASPLSESNMNGSAKVSLDRETFRHAFVSFGLSDPTTKFLKSVQHVHSALQEATDGMKTAMAAAPGCLRPERIEGLLTNIMPPGVSAAEIAELTRKCQSQLELELTTPYRNLNGRQPTYK